MIYLTGDTHGTNSIYRLKETDHLKEEDFLIILGDFGCIWSNNEEDKVEKKLKAFLESLKFTVLFIDGNHENHDRLDNLEVEDRFNGKVGRWADNVFHLKRGQVLDIDGVSIFVMGGAQSIDKAHRKEFLSWWSQEVPSCREMMEALNVIESIPGKEVDYVLTHTAPQSIIDWHINKNKKMFFPLDPTANFLQEVSNILKFKHWYFGHFHRDETYESKYTVLYESIIEISSMGLAPHQLPDH